MKIKNSHMEMMSDSPSSILEVREMIGTVMQPCKGITLLQVFHFFFNKMASIAKSFMTFVMLHNTDTKCDSTKFIIYNIRF